MQRVSYERIMKPILFLVVLLLLTPCFSAQSSQQIEKHYRMLHVVDGDTFDATDGEIKFRVRIAGMDAPEKGQEFGKWATVELKKLIEGKEISIRSVGKGFDQYNRILGQVLVDGQDVSLLMIKAGAAFYYRPQCRDYPEDKKFYDYDPRAYVSAEAEARSTGRVVWSRAPVTLPCQFRREHPRR